MSLNSARPLWAINRRAPVRRISSVSDRRLPLRRRATTLSVMAQPPYLEVRVALTTNPVTLSHRHRLWPPLLPTADATFSRRVAYLERASSRTRVLLSEGIAGKAEAVEVFDGREPRFP